MFDNQIYLKATSLATALLFIYFLIRQKNKCRTCLTVSTESFLSSRSSVATESLCGQMPLNLWHFTQISDISQFELAVRSFVFIYFFNEHSSWFTEESHSSVGDHRPLPVPHSTGATVSRSPQHRGSTSSPTNDVSFISTDLTVTVTDSSLEAAAAAANASLGFCRWLSFPRLPVLPLPTARAEERPHLTLALPPPAFSPFHIPSVRVVSSLAIS